VPQLLRLASLCLTAAVLGGCTGVPGLPVATPTASASGAISGVKDFRKDDPDGHGILSRNHVEGPLRYPMTPPAGGRHNPSWQNCEGDVYSAPIANERAVHSLEHGAVWVTYRPDLPKDQIDVLTAQVRGRNFTMLSPYPGLETAVSVQAWGVQLTASGARDKRIGAFIAAYREQGPEQGAPCSSGSTDLGPIRATVSG
jgi:hypothetical protein